MQQRGANHAELLYRNFASSEFLILQIRKFLSVKLDPLECVSGTADRTKVLQLEEYVPGWCCPLGQF